MDALGIEWHAFLNEKNSPFKQIEMIENKLLEVDTETECGEFDAGEYSITEEEIGRAIHSFEDRLDYFENTQGLEQKLEDLYERYLEATGYEENDLRLDHLAERTGLRDVYVDVVAIHYVSCVLYYCR